MSSKSRFSSESLVSVEDTLLNSCPSSVQDACCNCKGNARSRFFVLIPWAISFTLCVCLIVSQISHALFHKTSSTTTIQNWRESDFVTAKTDISAGLHTVRFDATIKFNDSHLAYRPPTQPAYVGQPSVEIDNNWKSLLGAVNIFVTPSEQKLLGTPMWRDPQTDLYMAEVTVFHDLHCLNMLRKAIYIEHYPEIDHFPVQVHIEHCIDALRLSLMCTGDMTLIPIEWSKNRNWINPSFDTDHTCRNYEALREWSIPRDASDDDRWPANAERLRKLEGL